MTVINANLSSSYFTVDLSQNAYLGFAHNLARYIEDKIAAKAEVGCDEKRYQFLGKEKAFAILKHLEFNQGHASFAGHLKDNNHQALNIPMNPPEIKGTLKQTVVMELSLRYAMTEELKAWVQQFLLFHRFAGGDIQTIRKSAIDMFNNEEDLAAHLQYEKGWVAQDATAQLVEVAKETDYSHAFCDFLSVFKEVQKGDKKKDDKISYRRHHNGWFYASLSGYQLLENPRTREGARYDQPHAYAEPIIGLHQLVYFKSGLTQTFFWFSEFNNNTYRLKQGI